MPTDAQEPVVASSSATLWAQASKEWVIPAKPKPGRKPKKDTSQPTKEPVEESKGRRVQNRAAQRAFRERKQSQLVELQQRVQSYEQGEIERNVALQQVSKRLKDENELLKDENASLKDELTKLKQRLAESSQAPPVTPQDSRNQSSEATRRQKRWRDEYLSSLATDDVGVFLEEISARKRPRSDAVDNSRISLTPAPQYGHPVSYTTSPPSMASSPDSNGISTAPFSPLPYPNGTGSRSSSAYAPEPLHSVADDALKGFASLEGSPFENFDCGLCADGGVCMCSELTLGHAAAAVVNAADRHIVNFTSFSNPHEQVLKVEEIESSLASVARSMETLNSIQEAAPSTSTKSVAPYQIRLPSPEPTPAPTPTPSKRSVPLRSKLTKRTASGKIWQISQQPSSVSPMCSGDPSNCPACKDDDFGKAFCQALVSARSKGAACASCPNPAACGKAPRVSGPAYPLNSTSSTGVPGPQVIDLTAAGEDQSGRTSATTSVNANANASESSLAHSTSTANPTSGQSESSETIPVNEAWARLKSHPNIAFADLSMLADVVARRSRCSGPVAVIHPAPGHCTPERDVARSPAVPDIADESTKHTRKETGPVLLTDPYRAQEEQRIRYASLPSSTTLARPSAQVADANAAIARTSFPHELLSIPEASAPYLSGARTSGKPSLVPQDQLRECGRRRIREVDTVGVNDALRMLDAQFGKQA